MAMPQIPHIDHQFLFINIQPDPSRAKATVAHSGETVKRAPLTTTLTGGWLKDNSKRLAP
jgi:hypothetical protein